MKWRKDLYLGESAGKKKNKIKKQLDHEKLVPGVYVITLASNGKDLLDILPAFMLFRDSVREREVIGLAVTKEEAFEVCEKIILDVYEKTGSYGVRDYFS